MMGGILYLFLTPVLITLWTLLLSCRPVVLWMRRNLPVRWLRVFFFALLVFAGAYIICQLVDKYRQEYIIQVTPVK